MRIAICGSMAFVSQMLKTKQELEAMGHEVEVSKFVDEYQGKGLEESELLAIKQKKERDAIREYWNVIQKVDAILVLNHQKRGIPGYIGGNTLMEIGFAYGFRKKIFLLNPVPDITYYRSEIEACDPIILNGDIRQINNHVD